MSSRQLHEPRQAHSVGLLRDFAARASAEPLPVLGELFELLIDNPLPLRFLPPQSIELTLDVGDGRREVLPDP